MTCQAYSLYLLLTIVKRETFVQAAVDVAVAQPIAMRNKGAILSLLQLIEIQT